MNASQLHQCKLAVGKWGVHGELRTCAAQLVLLHWLQGHSSQITWQCSEQSVAMAMGCADWLSTAVLHLFFILQSLAESAAMQVPDGKKTCNLTMK